MLLHILGHIHSYHCLLASKYCFSKCLGKLSFSNAGGTQE